MNISFINDDRFHSLLKENENPSENLVNQILNKALKLRGLKLEDAAVLININETAQLEKLFQTAGKIKDEIYGNRLVLFAPLYVSNFCSNNCLYCGFRAENTAISRNVLSIDEIKEETLEILKQGHKRVLMLMGEHHKGCTLDYFMESIEAVYSVKDSKGSSIRRINVEIAPLSDDEFQSFKKVPIGTYTVFQETYHKETYQFMHPSGKKADYEWRLTTMDRALKNGLHDVGIGALFGLYDYRFEVLSLLAHSEHLDHTYRVGPHTISIPRIRPAMNSPVANNLPWAVSDEDFRKLVAVIRCSVPYTGMILSTREPEHLRTELFNLGISQISAGSKTNIGGYKKALEDQEETGQFALNDCRSSGEVIQDVIERGYVPSFCTGCYRLGRVGEDFMDLAKPGLIKIHCLPNALTTLKEYLVDYATEETQKSGEQLIENQLNEIGNQMIQTRTKEYLKRIDEGERDLYF